ncbi:MAG: site-specific integrase [Oscillospiraceae bacterium]|nr:site-specific integrase [Oscillospiraceae bacterium]
MTKKSASGSGSLRKKTVVRRGQEYTYWEGRVTVGTDPGTGKPIRRSFTGKTQKEVREKMQRASVELTDGVYINPSKITVGEWLDTWVSEYLGGRKESTIDAYKTKIRVHIAPALGRVRLQALTPAQIQKFYNDLQRSGMAPTTIRLIHAILHEALDKAVKIGYIYRNPSDNAELPRAEKTEIHPLDAKETADFFAGYTRP